MWLLVRTKPKTFEVVFPSWNRTVQTFLEETIRTICVSNCGPYVRERVVLPSCKKWPMRPVQTCSICSIIFLREQPWRTYEKTLLSKYLHGTGSKWCKYLIRYLLYYQTVFLTKWASFLEGFLLCQEVCPRCVLNLHNRTAAKFSFCNFEAAEDLIC